MHFAIRLLRESTTFESVIVACQSARKKDPFAEQRDRYDGRSIRAGRGVGRA